MYIQAIFKGPKGQSFCHTKVLLENVWNSKQMITEGEAAIPLETTLHAFRNQEKTKQRSTIIKGIRTKEFTGF